VSAAHVSNDRLSPSSGVKRGVGRKIGSFQISLVDGRSVPLGQLLIFRKSYFLTLHNFRALNCVSGHVVAQLVEAQRYKLDGRGLDSRWCH
jgi:hypothetical protein